MSRQYAESLIRNLTQRERFVYYTIQSTLASPHVCRDSLSLITCPLMSFHCTGVSILSPSALTDPRLLHCNQPLFHLFSLLGDALRSNVLCTS